MESVTDYVYEQAVILKKESIDEDELLQKLENALDNGGDIDSVFRATYGDRPCDVTILQFSVIESYERVVRFVLSRGANIATKVIYKDNGRLTRHEHALELAVKKLNVFTPAKLSIFEMLRERSFQLYSSFGFSYLHAHFALHPQYWSDDLRQLLRTDHVNAAISAESPIWPGMTPILIAAKFLNFELVQHLLDLGADPLVRDPECNTPLHFLAHSDYFDERLFALDATNTFGSFNGSSHFHIACYNCPQALSIVKRYLDRGISPDLSVRKTGREYDPRGGDVGLHIAAEKNCPELTRLLLEYGAKIELTDSNGRSPIECLAYSLFIIAPTESLFHLVEVGSSQEFIGIDKYCTMENKLAFLNCVKKLYTLSESLVSERLINFYVRVLSELEDDWNEKEYTDDCLKELKALTDLGLRKILDDTEIVKSDFKEKFGWVDSLDFGSYPIYGGLLSIRFKRKMVGYEKKSEKIRRVIPLVQRLFQNQGQLPYLCAQKIIRNMSDEELDQILAQ